ncbi:hypothetical protein A0H76_1755 [Hepatospora eriocheir]|uniref:Uncharacterized protein n=1 Tax=Hepatospora eriocheir TaxID=1081669 RepID=A0A1X0Q9P6_9MICR|nr:hypothetical protein HERIO_1579 [Hepatospora eriocheir]ORE00268.1 hypothetical protein A0H76_1755 [Hepatospora eriocheir]
MYYFNILNLIGCTDVLTEPEVSLTEKARKYLRNGVSNVKKRVSDFKESCKNGFENFKRKLKDKIDNKSKDQEALDFENEENLKKLEIFLKNLSQQMEAIARLENENNKVNDVVNEDKKESKDQEAVEEDADSGTDKEEEKKVNESNHTEL